MSSVTDRRLPSARGPFDKLRAGLSSLRGGGDSATKILDSVCDAGFFVAATDGTDGEPSRYVPARPPGTIAVLDVLEAVRRPEMDSERTREPGLEVASFLAGLAAANRSALGHVTLEQVARGELAQSGRPT